jgi:hypothetical protein
MLNSKVETLNLEKLALCEKHDLLSFSRENLFNDHIMLETAH